jgi:hypothetical protein
MIPNTFKRLEDLGQVEIGLSFSCQPYGIFEVKEKPLSSVK